MHRLTTALADRYRIERELGAGGMATVYLAQDLKHDRQVAIKVLRPELAAVLGAERFVVEIKTTAALQHPHILPLFDSGSIDGFLFYVMPYVRGETLRDRLSRETQLGIDDAVRIAREVLDALQYAHEHGIVHRDVKPENILLHGGHAMVADFGIALAVSAAAGGRMTETGLSLGTPHYMSPEQATAEKEITPRSDVYSLGAVLYELLSGSPPHVGSSAQQVVMKIIAEPVPPVTMLRPSAPPNVAGAVAKALERIPADRFDSAKAFSEALANPGYTNAAFVGSFAQRVSAGPKVLMRALIAMTALAAMLLVVVVRGWLTPAPPRVVSHQRIVLRENQLINPGFVGRQLAISPDGETVVFTDSTATGWQLFAKERDRVDATVLAGTSGAQFNPTFSPDGAWIAFVGSDGKVKKVPRLGGSAVTLGESALPQGIAWLDDGTIMYVGAGSAIRAVTQDGGAPRQVLKQRNLADTTDVIVESMTGLPGGHAALLTTCPRTCAISSDLRVLDLRTLTVTVLQDQALQGWALPGGDVAFVQRDGRVFAAPFDMRRLAFKTAPTPVMDGVRTALNEGDIAVAADGTVIYVEGPAGAATPARAEPVWVTRAGAATPIDSGWTIARPADLLGRGLALSPDGRRLAVNSVRPGSRNEGDIWIKQLDHGPLTRLTFAGDNINPIWTLDGSAILFAGRTGTLRRRRADGSGPVDTVLTIPHSIFEIVPTGDSAQFMLRLAGGTEREIVLARRGDSVSTPLLSEAKFANASPALSPDRRWLAYESDESGHLEVYVRPYPAVSAGRWQVSTTGGRTPLWSHSGRELFFENDANALMAAAVLPGATFTYGTPAVLFDASQFAQGNERTLLYDVGPHDKHFVMLRPISSASAAVAARPDRLVQITNWADDVHAKLGGKVPK